MKSRANKANLKLYAKQLLGVNYTPENERKLINLCVKQSPEYKKGEHKSFAINDYLQKINDLIGCFGVESLYPDIDLEYCNAGDTYAITIFWYNDKLWIGDWGSVAERFIM